MKTQPKTQLQKRITISDSRQSEYTYILSEPEGKHFDKDFKPTLTPKEMLELGVFDGKYLNDCKEEFPSDWFKNAKLSDEGDESLNYFGIHASQPLHVWQEKGWINEHHDPRGWFQWYCRYYRGRRIPDEDDRQISRWKAMKRHIAQIRKNCPPHDLSCRKKQRQALLHWAIDSRKI